MGGRGVRGWEMPLECVECGQTRSWGGARGAAVGRAGRMMEGWMEGEGRERVEGGEQKAGQMAIGAMGGGGLRRRGRERGC